MGSLAEASDEITHRLCALTIMISLAYQTEDSFPMKGRAWFTG
jgi:hypothetical protein